VLEWLAERTWNDQGDVTVTVYALDDGAGVDPTALHERNRHAYAQRYLKRIWYGPRTMYAPADVPAALTAEDFCFEVVFDYGEHALANPTPAAGEGLAWGLRPDAFSTYRGGFELRTQRLCKRVLMFHRIESATAPVLVAATELTHEPDPAAATLTSVTHRRYVETAPGSYSSQAMPPVAFTYSPAALALAVRAFDRATLRDVPAGLVGGQFQWVDLHQEGIAGLLTEQGGQWYFKRNEGDGRFGPLETLPTRPSVAGLHAPGHRLADLGGDGGLQVVVDTPQLQGFFERTEEGGWAGFTTFVQTLGVDLSDPHVRVLDLDGDGRGDVLMTTDHAYTVWRSKGRQGFEAPQEWPVGGDEERGPRAVFGDPRQRIFLADMTGDGLQDIVRIENGNVCYWPNLGYGRFGAKVTMHHAPVFDDEAMFRPERVRLLDADGTGTTDVMYLGAHGKPGAKLWRNRSGNGFGPVEVIADVPALDGLTDIAVTDAFGTGTACLVWSSSYPNDASAAMTCIDLFAAGKPRLLIATENNLGSRTEIAYESSVRQYLRDRGEGRAWVTRLSFPVHVVSQVTTRDLVTNSHHTVSYRYRHGYYDREEREFRGFALAEQTDAESFAAFVGSGTFGATAPELMAQPPMVTKTWTHTGAYVGGERLEAKLRREYWRGDVTARDHQHLPMTTLPEAQTPTEKRLMARSLRGHTLRTEVYANDGTDKAGVPYAVTETRYAPRVVQPGHGGKAPVVAVDPCESVEWHYEREADDPRVTHALTLAVDDYGTVTAAATVGYPRRGPPFLTALEANNPEAAQAIRDAQAKLTVMVSTTRVTHVDTDPTLLRLGVPVASATYEVTGLLPPVVPASTVTPVATPTRLALLDDAALRPALTLSGSSDLSYHEAPPPPPLPPALPMMRRRLLERTEVRYYADDLSGPLTLGTVGRLALPYETRQAAFTTQMLTDAFRDAAGASLIGDVAAEGNTLLATEGGYVFADGLWWARGGRAIHDTSNFYLVKMAVDPWGHTTTAEYDALGLFVVRTIDALGNTTEAEYNTRLMAPWRLTDANGNRSMVSFDTLGRVVETYVMGKATGDAEGDVPPAVTLSGGTTVITPGLPGTTIAYDEGAWQRAQKPVWARVSVRENAGDAMSRWQTTTVYSDGFGRELVTKVRCEPDAATPTVARWRATGRTVYNRKGLPVKKYEPYFSDNDRYEPESEAALATSGVTPVLHYDPQGRVIRTDLPDGTFSRVEFDGWCEEHYDANDTVLDSAWRTTRMTGPSGDPNVRARELADAHAATPTRIYADALGRPVATVVHNGGPTIAPVLYATRVELDVQGQQRKVVDALNRLVQWSSFDMLGRALMTRAMDAEGPALPTSLLDADVTAARFPASAATPLRVSTKLSDIAGKHLVGWTERGYRFHDSYDKLRRLTLVRVSHPGSATEAATNTVTERLVYGEALGDTAARARNLRGRVWCLYDGAGKVESLQHDYRGQLLQATRRLPKVHTTAPDWDGTVPNEALLLDEVFTTTTVYDALGRVVEAEAPQTTGNTVTNAATTHARRTRYLYHEGGALQGVEARYEGDTAGVWTPYVDDIRYNARGQRMGVDYASGAKTHYDYAPKSFRLRMLKHTVVATETVEGIPTSVTKTAMHCTYTYDPVGNLVRVRDESVPEGERVLSTLAPNDSLYAYDALYRLVSAIGREHPANTPPDPTPEGDGNGGPGGTHPNDLTALSRYQETYDYDCVGNFTQMQHAVLEGGGTGWTRAYDYTGGTNRLRRTRAPSEPSGSVDDYGYDAHGNMTRMPHLAEMKWDAYEQMVDTRKGVGSDHIRVRCQYDAQGQRVRKVVEHWSGSGESAGVAWVEERLYLGGYEVLRNHAGDSVEDDITREVQTLHVMDGEQRVVMVTTKTVDTSGAGATTVYAPGDRQVHTRYQLGNHLGSAAVEVDEVGEVVTYEEYHPYGSCAMLYKRAGTDDEPKRYRFTGMERDETGLQYHTARYYSVCLGRWTSPDSLLVATTQYGYTSSPVQMIDRDGREPLSAELRGLVGLRQPTNVSPSLCTPTVLLAAVMISGAVQRPPAANFGDGASLDSFLGRAAELADGRSYWERVAVGLASTPGSLEFTPAQGNRIRVVQQHARELGRDDTSERAHAFSQQGAWLQRTREHGALGSAFGRTVNVIAALSVMNNNGQARGPEATQRLSTEGSQVAGGMSDSALANFLSDLGYLAGQEPTAWLAGNRSDASTPGELMNAVQTLQPGSMALLGWSNHTMLVGRLRSGDYFFYDPGNGRVEQRTNWSSFREAMIGSASVNLMGPSGLGEVGLVHLPDFNPQGSNPPGQAPARRIGPGNGAVMFPAPVVTGFVGDSPVLVPDSRRNYAR
jgi:RHS repeat-associated protein